METRTMRTAIFVVILAAVGLAPSELLAQGQQPSAGGAVIVATAPGRGTIERVAEITVSVEAVDAANRIVALKGPGGDLVALRVGPEVQSLDQIQIGDLVVVRYVEALTLELKKGGTGIPQRTDLNVAGTARPGERPAAGAAREVHVTADVIATDPQTQVVTLRGPTRIVDLKVHDPRQFELAKVGDQVEATYIEAVVISVEPAGK